MAETIGVCTIVRNEAESLPSFLRHYDPLVDEFCLLDTGSTDGTLDIQHPKLTVWPSEIFTGDYDRDKFNFAEARNEAVGRCTSDWILRVDVDYRFSPASWEAIRGFLATQRDKDVVLMKVHSADCYVTQGLFVRRSAGLRYINPVHEMIDISQVPFDRQIYLHDIEIEHLRPHVELESYEFIARHEWYLRLAWNYLEEHHTEWNVRSLVLKELYTLKRWPQYLKLAEPMINGEDGIRLTPMMAGRILFEMSHCYTELGAAQAAIEHARMSLYYLPHDPHAKWLLGEIYRNLGDLDEAEMWLLEAKGSPEPRGNIVYDEPEFRGRFPEESLVLVKEARAGKVWYEDGLQFECQKCGECCRNAGAIIVSKEECHRLDGMVDEDGSYGIIQTDEELHVPVCMAGDLCSMHDTRPDVCQAFPFWPQFLSSPRVWDQMKSNCPGIGQGRLYPLEEIRMLRTKVERIRREWMRAASSSPSVKRAGMLWGRLA